ncbi:Hypothetical protein POVN_LOCUS398 [uncultured virus]|nr:Hypothetical protein POVN_LOCUS398 [uncultured virus]
MRVLILLLLSVLAVSVAASNSTTANTTASVPAWNYKNFYPLLNTKTKVYEREDQVVARMNAWIASNNITVRGPPETLTRPVEAIVGTKLATIWLELVAATHAMKGESSGDARNSYHIRYMDVLRVWYIGTDIDTDNYINATDVPKPQPAPRTNGAVHSTFSPWLLVSTLLASLFALLP